MYATFTGLQSSSPVPDLTDLTMPAKTLNTQRITHAPHTRILSRLFIARLHCKVAFFARLKVHTLITMLIIHYKNFPPLLNINYLFLIQYISYHDIFDFISFLFTFLHSFLFYLYIRFIFFLPVLYPYHSTFPLPLNILFYIIFIYNITLHCIYHNLFLSHLQYTSITSITFQSCRLHEYSVILPLPFFHSTVLMTAHLTKTSRIHSLLILSYLLFLSYNVPFV